MIKMRDWRVFVPASDQLLGHEADHLLRRLEIQTDLDDGWAVMLDLEKDGQKNIVALELEEGVLSAALTRDMLRADGTYTAQLRGSCGEVVAHSNAFRLTVCGSIQAVDAFPETGPSYLEALEQRLLALKGETEQSAAAAQAAADSIGDAAQAAQTAAQRAETAAGSMGDAVQAAQTAAERAEAAEAAASAIVAGNEAYTKGESDSRFVRPIVERAAGETIALTDSMERPLQGLKLFGKTTRNAPPAPDAPAALESAGDSGQIVLSVTDGTQTKVQTLTLSTPNGLPGLPVPSGGSYTDGNGQRWICDEVDFARGKYVQRIHRQPLDGSEAWTNGWTNGGAVQRPSITLPFAILRPSDAKTKGIVLCDRFETVSAYETWMETTGISVSHEANVVQFLYPACPTISQWKAYLASHPSSFLVALADPVETELSPEALAQYAALHTNEPSTALSGDGKAGMEVAYAADTKRYLDKRLAAMLAAAGEEGA